MTMIAFIFMWAVVIITINGLLSLVEFRPMGDVFRECYLEDATQAAIFMFLTALIAFFLVYGIKNDKNFKRMFANSPTIGATT